MGGRYQALIKKVKIDFALTLLNPNLEVCSAIQDITIYPTAIVSVPLNYYVRKDSSFAKDPIPDTQKIQKETIGLVRMRKDMLIALLGYKPAAPTLYRNHYNLCKSLAAGHIKTMASNVWLANRCFTQLGIIDKIHHLGEAPPLFMHAEIRTTLPIQIKMDISSLLGRRIAEMQTQNELQEIVEKQHCRQSSPAAQD